MKHGWLYISIGDRSPLAVENIYVFVKHLVQCGYTELLNSPRSDYHAFFYDSSSHSFESWDIPVEFFEELPKLIKYCKKHFKEVENV